MAEPIVMPRQGNSVESCVLLKWRVKEGDTVQPKTIVADVETDKASFEVEAGLTGTVLKLLNAEGDDVPVMQPIAYVGKAGEAVPGGASSPAAPSPAVATAPAAAAPAVAHAASVVASSSGGVRVSPRARQLAVSRGLDASTLSGTGPGGRVIERDVRTALETFVPSPAASAPVSVAHVPRTTTESKMKGIRKLIADRMLDSLSTTAQFTLNAPAPAVKLQELRTRFKASDASLGLTGVTIGDLVVFATVRTLKRFPAFNAHKVGDTITEYADVHVGIACDTPRGLMVPVVRNAGTLSLKQISDETKRLSDACRNGTVKPDELSGSTFSVSNVGAFGVESFTPVLNVPEVAILGVGAISLKPVQQNGEVAFVPHVGLSLTINHMVVDGAPAARFLQALSAAIADIDLVLAQ